MKKLLVIILLLPIFCTLNAQIYGGVNAKISFPPGNNSEIDAGIGGEVLAGYSFHRKLDFHGSFANLWCLSTIPGYRISSLTLNARYRFLKSSINPYIGLGSGYFKKKIESPLGGFITESGIGVKPSVGVLFASALVKGLSTNVEISLSEIFTDHKVSLVNLNIGVLYCFEKSIYKRETNNRQGEDYTK